MSDRGEEKTSSVNLETMIYIHLHNLVKPFYRLQI
jgi:hypothetical protein